MHNTIIFFFITLFLMLLFFFIMGVIFFYFLKKNTKWIITVFIGFLYFNTTLTGLFFIIKSVSGHNAIEFIYSELNRNIDEILALEEKAGVPKQKLVFLRSIYQDFIIKTIPSWIICAQLFLIFLNYFVVRLYAIKKYNIEDGMKPFSLWKIDEKVIWLLIICLTIFIVNKIIHNDIIFMISLNGTFLLANIYFVAGLSVVTFFLAKYSVPLFIQFFVYVVIVMWSGFSIIVILTGILDTWFNFRKIQDGGGLSWK